MKYRKLDKKGTPYLLLSSLPNREEYIEENSVGRYSIFVSKNNHDFLNLLRPI